MRDESARRSWHILELLRIQRLLQRRWHARRIEQRFKTHSATHVLAAVAVIVSGATHANNVTSDYQFQSQCGPDAREWFQQLFMVNRSSRELYTLHSQYRDGSCYAEVDALLPYSDRASDGRRNDMRWVYEVNSNSAVTFYSRTLALHDGLFEYDTGSGMFEGKLIVGIDNWAQLLRERTGLASDYRK